MSGLNKINHILDIPELKESVLMIVLATGQIEVSMSEGNYSVDTLIDSFKSMSSSLKVHIQNNQGDNALVELKKDIDKSIISFQFYDRLNQRLEHVTNSLLMLSELVSSRDMVEDPVMWDKLKEQVRKSYSMESEHDMFKLIYHDELDITSALNIIKQSAAASRVGGNLENEDIELF